MFITGKVKFARIAVLAVRVTEQSMAVVQLVALPVPSVHPVKVEPLFAVARMIRVVGFG